jgi:hypothetical protein
MSKRKQHKTAAMTASAPQKMEAFTFGEPSPYWIAAIFSTTSSASITANGTSHRSISRGWRKACALPYTTAPLFTLSATS